MLDKQIMSLVIVKSTQHIIKIYITTIIFIKGYDMKKGLICIDMDSFFWPSDISSDYMCEERKFISIDNEEQDIHNLFEQYYLGFRSSMFICENKLKNKEDAIKILQSYREACIASATGYLKQHLNSNLTLPVDFMWLTRMRIVNELKNNYPEIENISFCLSMKPRISARTIDKNTIVFPALTRTVINHCNLVIINSVFQANDKNINSSSDIDRREIARFMLPYLLFCHDDFSVKNLPIIGAYSEEAIKIAFHYTNLQIMFIFAHEYAHILLQHFENDAFGSKSR